MTHEKGKVRVCIRVRPENAEEQATSAFAVEFADYTDTELTLIGNEGPQPFTFDHVFQPSASQNEVYLTAADGVVEKRMVIAEGSAGRSCSLNSCE